MSRATRWNSSNDLVRDRVNRLFEQAFGDALAREGEEVSTAGWTPPVDIAETEESLVLYAELPGLTKDQVEITLEDNTLAVRGERALGEEHDRESFHRVERAYGAFQRSFRLPANVRPDGVQARFQDGVLRIDIPKVEESKPRKIEIR
ncbi:MAG: Hsp20/alpha crystallin family protein [Thermoanaerobaculia bacterium]